MCVIELRLKTYAVLIKVNYYLITFPFSLNNSSKNYKQQVALLAQSVERVTLTT